MLVFKKNIGLLESKLKNNYECLMLRVVIRVFIRFLRSISLLNYKLMCKNYDYLNENVSTASKLQAPTL